MLDHDIKKAGTEPFRKHDPNFDERLFEGYETGLLDKFGVIALAEAQPENAVFLSAKNGVYVQVGEPGEKSFERCFIHYDGYIEAVWSVDEGAPPEAFGGE